MASVPHPRTYLCSTASWPPLWQVRASWSTACGHRVILSSLTLPVFSNHLLQPRYHWHGAGVATSRKQSPSPDFTSYWEGQETKWWRGSWGGSLWGMWVWELSICSKESLASRTPPAPAGQPRHASSMFTQPDGQTLVRAPSTYGEPVCDCGTQLLRNI